MFRDVFSFAYNNNSLSATDKTHKNLYFLQNHRSCLEEIYHHRNCYFHVMSPWPLSQPHPLLCCFHIRYNCFVPGLSTIAPPPLSLNITNICPSPSTLVYDVATVQKHIDHKISTTHNRVDVSSEIAFHFCILRRRFHTRWDLNPSTCELYLRPDGWSGHSVHTNRTNWTLGSGVLCSRSRSLM